MLNADVLTFQEFAMREPLPLSKIHQAVLEFCKDATMLFYSPRKPLTLTSASRE